MAPFAGLLSAAILVFATAYAGSPLVLFAYIASVPLFMMGFGAGLLSCVIAALCGAAGIFAFAPGSVGVFYLLADAAPAVAVIALAMSRRLSIGGTEEWCAEGKILTALASYPCLIFLGVFAATMGRDGGLLAMTLDAFHSVSDQVTKMLSENGQTITPEMTLKIQGYLDLCARIAPALVMSAWMFSTLIAMAFAQMIVRQRKLNLRPPFALDRLQVPNWVIFTAAITGIAAVYAPAPYDYIGLNLALVLGVPFFFVGLAVVHAWAARTRWPTLMLALFYVVISVIVHLVLLVALLGAIDQWIDFRKRFAEKDLTK